MGSESNVLSRGACLVATGVIVWMFLIATSADSQTVGSTTGAINGIVRDGTKAVVPGVTVTLSGPAVMGTPVAVTDEQGFYRFAAVPPGEYRLGFELPGFASIVREGIRISIGFTATVDVEMSPASVNESVTVTGASPVVDTRATNVTTNFETERLANLPGAHDFHSSILAQVPAVTMNRVDVGGNNAMTPVTYSAYGTSGQGRAVIEGMVATYVNNNEMGMYLDYGSIADIAVTAAGNTAEMPTGGVLSQVIAKSGGNSYHGTVYLDYQNKAMGTRNIDDDQLARGVVGGGDVSAYDVNRLEKLVDLNADIGGFVVKDRLWWYFSYRYPAADQGFPNLIGKPLHTEAPNLSAKATYNLSQNNKLIGYYTRSNKKQPDYLGSFLFGVGQTARSIHTTDSTWDEEFPSGVWKGEYSSVLTNSMLLELRGGMFFSNFIRDGKSDDPWYEDRSTNAVSGGNFTVYTKLNRPQFTGSLSYFKSGWMGTHSFKFGGEFLHDTSTNFFKAPAGDVIHVLSNSAPLQVYVFQSPSTSINGINTSALYANDTWAVDRRLTLNLGLRFDRYRSFWPEQQGPSGQQFPARNDVLTWNNLGPRVGLIYDLLGTAKTLVKFNFGQYWGNPFTGIASGANPNSTQWYSQYAWNDRNANRIYDRGEEGALVATRGGTVSTGMDPNLENHFTREALIYLEHELMPDFGVRTGFTWRGTRQERATIDVNRPYAAFTVPATVTDPGPDGVPRTTDDGGTVAVFNLQPDVLAQRPLNILQNIDSDSDYYTWEVTATKRSTSWWSLIATFANTWSRTGVNVLSPNDLINRVDGRDHSTRWQFKVNGTLQLPNEFRVTPVLRHQAGRPYGRTFVATLNYGSPALLAEPVGTRRTDNITVFDLRTERSFRVGASRFAAFVDLYNIFNTNAEQDINTASGSAWLRPLAISGPRTARVGARYEW